MTHPTSFDLMEYRRGELDAQRRHEILQHLEECEPCRNEWEKWVALEEDLAEWKAPRLSAAAVDSIKSASYEAFQSSQKPTGTIKLVVRRVLTTAAIIFLTFVFQSLVWNPVKPVIEYRTTLNLLPSMISMPTADAATSTTLYLTVHPNQMVSSQYLDGQHQLAEIGQQLLEAGLGSQFESVMIMGSNPERPVRFETDSLDDLQRDLEINAIEFGPGLMALELHDRFIGKLFFRAGIRPFPNTPGFEIRPHTVTIDSTVYSLSPGTPMEIGNEADEQILLNLRNPQQVILGVNTNDTVSLNHAIIPMNDINETLELLHNNSNGISLIILIQETMNIQQTGFRIANIANRVGIDRVMIKRIMTPNH